ncbi:hypothetical protein Ae201684_015398 [Aphanomyces euteiches]|uniref:Reverse transcriptase domain-containing protein n=1 Tax=Aphanomyces euteiches TaxID=100861 RepID=A0A6G0WGL7_9STRA|nr:hypothetical protein Ae201684_015398 [Aphanomyces euteiches]
MSAAAASTSTQEMDNQQLPPGPTGQVTTNASSSTDSGPGRTFADTLRQKAATTPSKITLRIPLPNADRVQELLDYESQPDCDVEKLAEMMLDANTYAKIVSVGSVWFDTGSDLAQRTQNSQEWAPWLPCITRTRKARNGQLILSVSTIEAKSAISDLSLKLFCKTYKVSQPAVKRRAEVLDKYFYLDIAGVDADFDFKSATKGFFLWKLRPLVHLFTNVVPDTTFSFSSNVLRFYFCSETTPANLSVNSNLANHIQLDGKAYAIFPKGHTASVNTNGRQPVHCLNLDDVLQPAEVEEGQTPHKRQCVVLGEEDGKPDVQAQQKQQNNFEDPKKTAKRKEAPKPTAHSNGMSNNMYEVLRDINIVWTRLHNSGGDPLPTFVPDVTPLPKASYDSSSSIQKTSFNPTTKSLEWHPDAMSMEAIVQTLASVNTDSSVRKINAEEISLPDVEAVSVEISPLLQSAAADTIWTKIAANPLGMASYLIDLHGSGSPLFAQLARLHAGHRWFRLLYNNTSTQLIINGSLGKTIYPNRGVKQGDPLSSLLFVLSIEPLAQHLRDNSHLGLSFDNLNPPRALASLLFADDCTLLSPSKRAIDDQLELVQLYCDASGARLNLGIVFGHRLPASYQIQAISNKFFAAFPVWRFQARTLQGRKLITQTKILSTLWHYTAVLPVSTETVKSWQAMVTKFILSSKTLQSDKHMASVNPGLQFDKVSGLGIPTSNLLLPDSV